MNIYISAQIRRRLADEFSAGGDAGSGLEPVLRIDWHHRVWALRLGQSARVALGEGAIMRIQCGLTTRRDDLDTAFKHICRDPSPIKPAPYSRQDSQAASSFPH